MVNHFANEWAIREALCALYILLKYDTKLEKAFQPVMQIQLGGGKPGEEPTVVIYYGVEKFCRKLKS